jgi:carboxymethylenebutenolidase
MTNPRQVEIAAADGVCAAWLHGGGDGPRPAVLLFPDAFGVRPAMQELAARLAGLGHVVLLPDVFYRAGAVPPFDAASVWGDPPERERLTALIRSITPERLAGDAAAYLAALAAQPGVHADRVATVGYCMGGRLAFLAAAQHPAAVRAVASFHGGHLVTDGPDSPHRLAARLRAAVHLGVADDDRSCTPEHQGALAAALAAADVAYALELYRGKKHGFAVPDHPVYDRDAAERHWRRLEAFLGETLG